MATSVINCCGNYDDYQSCIPSEISAHGGVVPKRPIDRTSQGDAGAEASRSTADVPQGRAMSISRRISARDWGTCESEPMEASLLDEIASADVLDAATAWRSCANAKGSQNRAVTGLKDVSSQDQADPKDAHGRCRTLINCPVSGLWSAVAELERRLPPVGPWFESRRAGLRPPGLARMCCRIQGLGRGTQALDSSAVLGISSEKLAALRQDLFRGPGSGHVRLCACPGVCEGQVGAVHGQEVIRAVEVLGQQRDVAALAAQDVYLLA